MQLKNILNVDDHYFDVFMSISSALTGHTLLELQGTGQATAYYTHILGSLEAGTFTEFLRTAKTVIDTSFSQDQLNNNIARELMASPDLQEITGKVITLWYLGTWGGAFISAAAYTEGLVWSVMGSHPPGAKQPGFKSWNVEPLNT